MKKKQHDLESIPGLAKTLPLEAQVMDIADEISYTTHDLDDGIESGLILLRSIEEVPLWKDAIQAVRGKYPKMDEKRIRSQVLQRLINEQVNDVVNETRKRLAAQNNMPSDDTVAFSEELASKIKLVHEYLFANLYRHPRVMRSNSRSTLIVQRLFEHYCNHPKQMSQSYQDRIETEGLERSVADFIAGMTDRYAEIDSKEIFGV